MKDERGASFYAATLCALQEKTDVAAATYFEADIVKEFCGIFDVDEMSIGGLLRPDNLATVKPTKGFYAFKSYNTLYRMGEQVLLSCDDESIFATAATGENGNGVLVANEKDEATEVTLSLSGVKGSVVIRLTDASHTNERIAELTAGNALTVTLPLAPHSFVYIGTDLPDPVPQYQ
jgi:hypothetical protein